MRLLLQALWSALLATLVGLIVAAKSGLGVIVTVAAAFAVVLAYWMLTDRAATTRWPALGRLPGAAPMPWLGLRSPVVERAAVVAQARASGPVGLGVPPFEAEYVKVPVSNDRHAAVAAEDVQGWLAFRTADGDVIAEEVQARWAHTEQAPDRSEFARMDDPALNEVRIAAGSTRHIDVAACADQLGGFRMWTNRSMTMLADPQFALGDREVLATLTVRGSNAPEQSATLRLTRGASGVGVSADP